MKHPNARIEALLTALPAASRLPAINLKLGRITNFLAHIGNPQDRLAPVIHVAGTNGKGSLLAYLSAIFQAAGYKVHRYISPHLVRFNERILLADHEISDAQLLELLERITGHVEQYPLTFFEATTAAAFLAFSETPADIVLLETGLGGRLDATNMVRAPLLTAITPVSMDHMEYLGDTLAEIAGEKAGILKPGVPCVVGPQVDDAQAVIERAANKIGAPLYSAGKEWRAIAAGTGFEYSSPVRQMHFALPGLVGVHQIANAATAIACLEQQTQFTVIEAHIKQGLLSAKWPARLQQLTNGKLLELLPNGAELWLDGGHNAGAGQVLAAWESEQVKPVHIICAMLVNKDTYAFLRPQAKYVKTLTAVSIEDEPAAQTPQHICNIGESLHIPSAAKDNVKDAIQHIVNNAKNDFIILICGSLYLAGNILWQNGGDT